MGRWLPHLVYNIQLETFPFPSEYHHALESIIDRRENGPHDDEQQLLYQFYTWAQPGNPFKESFQKAYTSNPSPQRFEPQIFGCDVIYLYPSSADTIQVICFINEILMLALLKYFLKITVMRKTNSVFLQFSNQCDIILKGGFNFYLQFFVVLPLNLM